jgi:hypothetical protein
MLDEAVVERRLATLEGAVRDLQRRLARAPAPADWLDKVIGSVSDEAAFNEALEFGRAIRNADRPPDEPEERP